MILNHLKRINLYHLKRIKKQPTPLPLLTRTTTVLTNPVERPSKPSHTNHPTQNPTSRHRLEAKHRLERKVVGAIVQLEPAAWRALYAELHDLGHPAAAPTGPATCQAAGTRGASQR